MIIITNAAGMQFIDENVHPDHYTEHNDLRVVVVEDGPWSDFVMQSYYREQLNLICLPEHTEIGEAEQDNGL